MFLLVIMSRGDYMLGRLSHKSLRLYREIAKHSFMQMKRSEGSGIYISTHLYELTLIPPNRLKSVSQALIILGFPNSFHLKRLESNFCLPKV